MNSIDLKEFEINQQIISFLEGKSTLPEEKDLQTWIHATADNKLLFIYYRDLWLATSAKVASGKADNTIAWQKISHAINNKDSENNLSSGAKIRSGIQRFLQVAALVIFIFTLGAVGSWLFYGKPTRSVSGECIVSTPLGSRTFLILPDKSEVWLNAGSKVTYPKEFDGKQRKVSLEGEAFFKVKSDKRRPFIVSTKYMDVKALGTSFNVKAYDGDQFAVATLVEGSIKVEGNSEEKKFSYTLTPNQNIIISAKTGDISAEKEKSVVPERRTKINAEIKPRIEAKSVTNTEAIVSWKDQLWTLQGEDLNSLAVLLERRYNIKIHLTSDLLKEYKFTGTIKNETLEQVLQYLRFTTPLKYEIGKGEVWWDVDPELVTKYSKILNK